MEQPLGAAMGALIWADLGFCAMADGESDSAEKMFQKGLTEPTGTKFLARPLLLVGSAFLELGRGSWDQAAKLVQEAGEFVEERQMKHFYPLVALAEGQVTAAGGDGSLALEHLARGERLALEMQMRPMVLRTRLGAAQILAASGRSSEAEAKLAEARAMIDEIGGLFEDEELRDSYLETATKKLT